MPDLYQLAYVSDFALTDIDEADAEEMTEWHLEAILDASMEHNSRCGLTGAMLFCGEHFAQVLEGPQTALRGCYDKICNDRRHSNLSTLFYTPIEKRAFPDVPMMICATGYGDAGERYQILKSPHDLNLQHAGHAMLHVLADSLLLRSKLFSTTAPVTYASSARQFGA